MRALKATVAAAPLCGLLWFVSAPACAADKPELAPAPPWVKAVAVPAPPAKADPAPGRVLLMDRQVHFDAEGTEVYLHMAMQFLTPQGLQVGPINLDWHPDFETLVFHKVRILRAGNVIDVLAQEEPYTILRRESSLEKAKLDGKLTASIQPEGLEVGDVLEVEFTQRQREPVVGPFAEMVEKFSTPLKIEESHERILWATSKPVRWRATPDLDVKETKAGGEVELVVKRPDLDAPTPPLDAPKRYRRAYQLEVSQFSSWDEASRTLWPLWEKALTLKPDSPFKAEAARIAAATSDPKARAQAALRLVEEKTRYVYIGINLGGYTPARADLTWARRFGDCKGKAALLTALLRELGIDAEPVLVSTTDGDGMDARLPALQYFDHAIVRATVGGRTYWLDGTRNFDRNIDTIDTPEWSWALPLRSGGAALQKIELKPFDTPESDITVRIDATGGAGRTGARARRVCAQGRQGGDDARPLGEPVQGRRRKERQDPPDGLRDRRHPHGQLQL